MSHSQRYGWQLAAQTLHAKRKLALVSLFKKDKMLIDN